MSKELIFYTDGSCLGNPGKGGLGIALFEKYNSKEFPIKLFQKLDLDTTNNREELKAILYSLQYILKNSKNINKCVIFSDSAYCVNACNDWIYKWATKEWMNSKKEEIKNKDLFVQVYSILVELSSTNIDIHINKIKGHNNILGNELADAIATNNKNKIKKVLKKIIINNR